MSSGLNNFAVSFTSNGSTGAPVDSAWFHYRAIDDGGTITLLAIGEGTLNTYVGQWKNSSVTWQRLAFASEIPKPTS
jgi:hypothetical protein